MAKLREAQAAPRTPSEEIIADNAPEELTVTDKRGRQIVIKKPNILAEYRLVEAAGADLSKNQQWMGMAMPILWVVSIAGDKVPMPRTKREIEALIQRLDSDGLEAITDKMIELVMPEGGEEETDEAGFKEQLKNE